MDHASRVDAVRREAMVLAAAAARVGPDAAVPSCPGWDVAELLAHVGIVHRWASSVLAGGLSFPEVEPPPGAQRPEWVVAGATDLADVLAAADPQTPAWSWTDDRTVGFWARRQAAETAVHRVDAELAAGRPGPVERDLAVDAVDEFLAMLTARRQAPDLPTTGTVHLHCTDGDGEWLVRLTDSGPVVTREHAKGDVALRGAASDLLLVAYGRLGVDVVETFGDATLAGAFLAGVSW